MKKIGSIQFFENIDLNLNFTFDDLMNHFRKSAEGVKNEFLNIVMTKSFQFALDKIAEAFQKRAEQLFNKA